ncbi:MAG: hypothetical protein ACPGSD_08560 [Flavobacteriales bacterium]
MNNIKIIFLTSLILVLTTCTDKKFDSFEWKAWSEKTGEFALRWDMCDDLIDKHLLIGMTKEKVVRLLGMPMSDCDKPNCDIIYELGPCRSGINYGSLYLTLKDNKIIKIYKHCG